jgi:hypothetical protein
MPRAKRVAGESTISRVQQQARALYDTLQDEIRKKENELEQLKEEAQALHRLGVGMSSGPAARSRNVGPTPRGGMTSGGRIDWRAMLDELPKQFKAADIRNIGVVKNKRPSEIFAAITRWIEAGLVKRKARGVYERA